MRTPKILTVAAIGILLAATPSFAGQRRAGGGSPPHGSGGSPAAGHAVPRGPTAYPRSGYPGHGGPYYGYGHAYYRYPYYGYYGPAYYGYPYYYGYPGFSFSFGFGFGYPYGYAYPAASGYYAPYGYPRAVAVAPGRADGGVRIALDQRDAEVFVDGSSVGVVGDFDGTSQPINLQPGSHRLEVRRDGFAPLMFDVNVRPGETLTYRTRLRPTTP
jgi:hypothetical protein